MKSFYMITNELKDPALRYTNRVISFFAEAGRLQSGQKPVS